MRFTVFTPTYNRAYTLERLFDSMQRQTYTDFEWIVVDDGSTDNTKDLINSFLLKKPHFPIVYKYVDNGGKHRAINHGLKMASGTMFIIVDSDDYLVDNALEILDRVENSIHGDDKHKFSGICGLKAYSEDRIIGKTFEGDYLDITTFDRAKNNICGDKAEVYYTDILKQYPFPEYDNEKFVTECVVWDKMSYDGYLLRYFNVIIQICNYLPDGLSSNYQKLLENNPKGYGVYLSQATKYGQLKGLNKWNEYTKYYYSQRDKMSFKDISKNLNINPIIFWIRLFGIKVFNKLYDQWG